MSETAPCLDAPVTPALSIADNQLVVSGCLDVDNVGALRNQGIALIEGLVPDPASGAVVVDLGAIDAQGSAVIALLIAWQRHLVREERSITFLNASDELKAIAAACGVAEILALA